MTRQSAIIESNWGERPLAKDYNNVFGVKGTGPAGSVTMSDDEENPKPSGGGSAYRKYNDGSEAVALVGATILKAVCDYCGTYLVNYAGFCMITDQRSELYDATLRRSVGFFSKHSTGCLSAAPPSPSSTPSRS